MNLKCILGHKWNGCICQNCGAARDEGHDWDKCNGRCRKCGKECPVEHEWKGCRCLRCNAQRDEGHEWLDSICRWCGKNRPGTEPLKKEAVVLAEIKDNHGQNNHITVKENEIIINSIHVAIRDISKVVYHPIEEKLQGCGGWIKFVTEDNPVVPFWGNSFWEVTVNGKKCFLFEGNVFLYGCDYYGGDEGWEKMNERAAEIVALVKKLISPNNPGA